MRGGAGEVVLQAPVLHVPDVLEKPLFHLVLSLLLDISKANCAPSFGLPMFMMIWSRPGANRSSSSRMRYLRKAWKDRLPRGVWVKPPWRGADRDLRTQEASVAAHPQQLHLFPPLAARWHRRRADSSTLVRPLECIYCSGKCLPTSPQRILTDPNC